MPKFFLVVLMLLVLPSPAGAQESYQLPVDAPVSDTFRPPATPYGAGNRGWEFATTPGESVKAAQAGTITYAGQVGGVLNVVIKHDDGLKTTYSKLASVAAVVGMHVAPGQSIGTAGSDTYFGVRENGEYIDPASIFNDQPYLVANSPADTSPGAPAPVSSAAIAWLQQQPPAYWPQLRDALSQLHL